MRPSYLGDIIDAVSEPIEGARRAQASPCQHNWRAIPWPVVKAVTRGVTAVISRFRERRFEKAQQERSYQWRKIQKFRNGPMLIGSCHVLPSLPTYLFVVGDLGSRRSTTCCATAPFRLQGGDNGRRNNIPRLRAVAHQSPSGLPLVAV